MYVIMYLHLILLLAKNIPVCVCVCWPRNSTLQSEQVLILESMQDTGLES